MSPHSPRRAPSQYPETHVYGSPSAISHQSSAKRRGFTLIELMVVIVIISILVAFLLPAIARTRATARVAEAKVDISALESAITTFRTEFGIDPPSRITLYERPTGDPSWTADTSNTPASETQRVRSRTLVRRLWPQFDFSAQTTTPPGSGWDINGDGDKDDVIVLTGSECLLFFLGGVTATSDANGNTLVNAAGQSIGTGIPAEWVALGFSKNPRNPFERSSGTRIGPFNEFNSGRFVNVDGPSDTEAMPEYLDTLPGQTMPYVYVTSSDGKGYDPLDLTGTTMTNVYLQKDDNTSTIGDPSEVPWNQSGFQIISPGFDALYGLGGLFDESEPFDVQSFPMRIDERDNITNFASGMLEE